MAIVEKNCKNCARVFVTSRDFMSKTSRWRNDEMGNYWFNCSCNSTMMIPRSLIDESVVKEAVPNLFAKLDGVSNIPSLPNSVMELQLKLDDPEFKIEEVVFLVKKDPFLMAEVIHASIVLFDFEDLDVNKQGGNILEAITHIGSVRLKELVLAAGIKKSYSTIPEFFNLDKFWETAYLSAAVCVSVARKANLDIADEAYLGGLFSNFGKLISATNLAEEYKKVLDIANHPKNKKLWHELEKDQNIIEHTLLGEIGGTVWGLPAFCLEAMSMHHDLNPPSSQLGKLVVPCVRIGNQLVHWIQLESSQVDETYLFQVADSLKLDSKAIESIAADFAK